jgi:hypothetical protein
MAVQKGEARESVERLLRTGALAFASSTTLQVTATGLVP